MVTPEVYPQSAAAAGCTASYSVDRTQQQHSPDAYEEYDITSYSLSATEANGWTFDHFEWTTTTTSSGVYEQGIYPSGVSQHRNSGSQQGPGLYVYTPRNNAARLAISDWTRIWHDYPDVEPGEPVDWRDGAVIGESVRNVSNCRAVFNPPSVMYGDITVETSADPAAGGTTSPLSETHQYAGSPSTTFTLTATANAGYRFWRWELDDAAVGFSQTLTVTHYFTASPQTFHYVAKFLPSSAILYGASGAILYGTSGAIVHGG